MNLAFVWTVNIHTIHDYILHNFLSFCFFIVFIRDVNFIIIAQKIKFTNFNELNTDTHTHTDTYTCAAYQIIKRKNEKENRIVKFNLIDSFISLMRFQALTHIKQQLSKAQETRDCLCSRIIFSDAELAMHLFWFIFIFMIWNHSINTPVDDDYDENQMNE